MVKNILVVGGGLTGMTAALEASQTGYDVILVEKENTLGGCVKSKLNFALPNPLRSNRGFGHDRRPDVRN